MELRERVAELMGQARADLAELVSYRSVADPRQYPVEECERAAEWVVDRFTEAGFSDVRLVETADGSRAVYGARPCASPDAPTVLLYSPQFPQQHAEAAERFLVAYLRGVRAYVATMQGGGDRTPIYRILAEYTPLKDLDLYAALAPANLSPDGALSTDSLRADQEFWVQRGLVPQPADLATAIDLHYLEAARRHLDRSR